MKIAPPGNEELVAHLRPSKARANACYDIVLFRSPATWTRKARHGTKMY